MKFHVLTLFPEMITQGLGQSITKRAIEKHIIEINAVNIRDYTTEKHGKVDDYTYGGGAGMLIQAEPVYQACQSVSKGKKIRTVYVTPQGKTFDQKLAGELSKEEELVILCGHYEGIDERVLEETVTDFISIGDYVLTGGELPAMVMIDAISRLVPGVLHNDQSAETESFHNDLLEYPQYSRPEVWHGKEVPAVLLSGNHKKINDWRIEASRERTKKRRPDLYARYEEKQKALKQLLRNKKENAFLIHGLLCGTADLARRNEKFVMGYDRTGTRIMLAGNVYDGKEYIPESMTEIISQNPKIDEIIVNCGKSLPDAALLERKYRRSVYKSMVYTQNVSLPQKIRDIRKITVEQADMEFPQWRLACACGEINTRNDMTVYAGYLDKDPVGIMAIQRDSTLLAIGSYKADMKGEIMKSLFANHLNEMLKDGGLPYILVKEEHQQAADILTQMGVYTGKSEISKVTFD